MQPGESPTTRQLLGFVNIESFNQDVVRNFKKFEETFKLINSRSAMHLRSLQQINERWRTMTEHDHAKLWNKIVKVWLKRHFKYVIDEKAKLPRRVALHRLEVYALDSDLFRTVVLWATDADDTNTTLMTEENMPDICAIEMTKCTQSLKSIQSRQELTFEKYSEGDAKGKRRARDALEAFQENKESNSGGQLISRYQIHKRKLDAGFIYPNAFCGDWKDSKKQKAN